MENKALELKPTKQEIALEIVKLKVHLDSVKSLYDKLDQLTLQFKEVAGVEEVMIEESLASINGQPMLIPQQFVKIVDNFAVKNAVFKTAAVRRFEINTETFVERLQKEIKKSKSK